MIIFSSVVVLSESIKRSSVMLPPNSPQKTQRYIQSNKAWKLLIMYCSRVQQLNFNLFLDDSFIVTLMSFGIPTNALISYSYKYMLHTCVYVYIFEVVELPFLSSGLYFFVFSETFLCYTEHFDHWSSLYLNLGLLLWHLFMMSLSA